MNYSEAKEIRAKLIEIGGFSEVKTAHDGFLSVLTPAIEIDGKWTVEIWSINARAGNRNLTVVREYTPDLVPAIARSAKGKATASDKAAFARVSAEKEMGK